MKIMTDEQISNLSAPEITELIRQLTDELDMRMMAMAGTSEPLNYDEMPFLQE